MAVSPDTKVFVAQVCDSTGRPMTSDRVFTTRPPCVLQVVVCPPEDVNKPPHNRRSQRGAIRLQKGWARADGDIVASEGMLTIGRLFGDNGKRVRMTIPTGSPSTRFTITHL